MENFITRKTYEAICAQWARTIMLLSESEIHIWPPLSSSYTFVKKFVEDIALTQKLFGELNPDLVLLDCHELEKVEFEDIEKQFFAQLSIDTPNQSLDSYLSTRSNLTGVFIVGFDNAMKHKNTASLKQIGTLLGKHPHLSLILITELPIPESSIFQDLIAKHMLVQNIYYQSLFSLEDTMQYISHIQKDWHFHLSKGLDRLLAENIGGHMLLLTEALRIGRENPTYTIQEILQTPSLVRKALAIFHFLYRNDQITIHELLSRPTKKVQVSEYLLKTGLVKNGKVGLQYLSYLSHNVLDVSDFAINKTQILLHHLSRIEQNVLTALQDTNDILSRDALCKVIWGEDWELKYSDWALGQIMHRLREKLEKIGVDFIIETKKGEGFYVTEK